MVSEVDTSFIPDVPKGPLDTYRNKAKFDWKLLRLVFEDAYLLRVKYHAWKELEANPLFAKPKQTLSSDDQKYRAALQMNAMHDLKLFPADIINLGHKEKVRIFLLLLFECDSLLLSHYQCVFQ